MSECKISEVSSRVCERGTKCCVVQHGGEMSDTLETNTTGQLRANARVEKVKGNKDGTITKGQK